MQNTISTASHGQTPSRETWGHIWEKSAIPRPVHTHLINALHQTANLQLVKTLEIGCGSAVDSAELARRGSQAFALDYAWQAFLHAKNHVREMKQTVRFAAGDTFNLPFAENTFDIVFSQGLIEHFTNPAQAIAEQTRVLRPGGILCVDVPQKWCLAHLYTLWQIQRGTWFAGWETAFSLEELEMLMRQNNLQIANSYGWLYFPAFLYGIRNLHTFNERHSVPIWINDDWKQGIEKVWRNIESRRWYYRWLGCIGVVGQKQ